MNQKQKISPKSANPKDSSGVNQDPLEQTQDISTDYSTLLHKSLDGFSVIDFDGNIIDCNPALCQMLRYTRQELLTLKVSDIDAAESTENTIARIEQVKQTGGDRFQTRHRRKDGKIIAVEISIQYDPTFGQRFFVFSRDISAQKHAEEALLQSEENYRVLFEAESDAILLVDEESWQILEANQAASTMHGYSREEILSLRAADLSAEEEQTEIVTRTLPPVPDQEYTFPLRWHRKKDGTRFPVEITGRFFMQEGRLVHIAAIRDITERIRAEAALRQNELLLNRSQEQANIGSFVWDLQTASLTWSRNMYAIHGLDPNRMDGELVDVSLRQVHPDERIKVLLETEKMIQSRQVWPVTFRFTRPDGVERIIFSTGEFEFDSEGRPIKCIGIHQDITEQRQTEQTLRESEAKYRFLAENVTDVIWILDAQTLRFRYVSPAVERLRGYTAEEAMAQDLAASITPASAAYINKVTPIHIAEFESGIVKTYAEEIEQPCKDGSTVWTETSTRYMRNPENGHLEVYGVSRNISERKQAQEALRKLNDELEQRVVERTAQLQSANRELEAFSYSISHDLRGPLRGIDGWSQVLLEDYGDRLDEQGHVYLNRVRAEAQRLGRLIDDILQLSRMTRSEMHFVQVNLSATALETVNRLKEIYPHRAPEIIIQPELTTRGDARLLEVMLANLFDNAFKFTGKTPNARIEFGQTTIRGERAFFVHDNGVGFDMAYASKLFGAFQRLHGVSEFPGSGIGLATVQRIIHRHGGKVWADAQVDQGTTIYFSFADQS